MRVFSALCASEGLAIGPVCRVRHARPALGRYVGDPRYEQALYEAASRIAAEELETLEKRANPKDRDIFLVQRMMLEDGGLMGEILAYIRAGAGAAAAVERAAGIYSRQLRAVNDAYLSERAADVLDACQRVVDILDGRTRELPELREPSILVSEELYPTDIVSLERDLVLGFVTARGAANAHAAILARTLGIPALVMAGDSVLEDCENKIMILDGAEGTAYLEPDDVTRARFSQKQHMEQRYQMSLELLRNWPCMTRDGTRIHLYADCSSPEQVSEAVSVGAEGIGLLRPEYLYLAGRVAGEEEQYQFYKSCIEAANGLPVTVTTYDLAADKIAAQIPGEQTAERNPALGLRGLRYCLTHKQFFLEQLMALLRAACHGPLSIALPMVTVPEDVLRAQAELKKAKAVLSARGEEFCADVPVGILVETPAAALMVKEFAQTVAFFNVNGNDLAQYTYAADRTSSLLQHYFTPVMPAVRKLILMASEAAQQAGVPMLLSGTGAAEPLRVEAYARAGVHSFCMAPRSIPEIKAFLRDVCL